MLPSYQEVFSKITIPYDGLNQLKQEQKEKTKKWIWLFWISMSVTIISWLSLPNLSQGVGIFSIVSTGVFIFAAFKLWFKIGDNKTEYAYTFKRAVVGPLASKMLELAEFPNEDERYEKYCNYSPSERISGKWINKSELFAVEIDDTIGEDLFSGKVGLTEFQFSELKMTVEETSTDSDGTTTTSTRTVFDGVLFVADFKKDFAGLTVVETKLIKSDRGVGKLMGKLINGAGSTANRKGSRKIELESAEFNRHFLVRTTDEVEARYILSSKMLERIIQFKDAHPYSMTISFHKSFMFIALSSTKNFFDEGITKVNGEYQVEGVYNDLAFFFNIIEDFDLNTRIWSKE